MVLGLMDLDIDLAEVGELLQENVFRAVEKAKSILGMLASYIYSAFRWVLNKIWIVMQYAYRRAIDFFYKYIELAQKDPPSFAKLSLSMIVLFGR